MIKKNNLLLISSLIIGLILTFIFYKFDNYGLTNLNWISTYDSKSDFLALKFFINDKWHFPVGLNPTYGELNNSIVFSGAVPFLSLFAKLFKNFLPYNFHYFSIWIFICFYLHIFFSFKVIFYLTKNNLFSIVGSLFFLFTPILFQRLETHLSLGAHWLIIAFIYLEINSEIKNRNFLKTVLIIFSSLVHFYFTIILLLMSFIFISYENVKLRNLKNFFKEIFLLLIPLIVTMYLVGYFSIPASDSLGFGYGIYKANLLTFFDSSSGFGQKSWSLFLPDIKNSKGETEGFGYFGLGVIILIFILINYFLKNFKKIISNYIKYLVVILIFFLIAISSTVSFGSFKLIDINLPNFLYAPLSVIRASGRFIWPVYYLIIFFSLLSFYKFKFKIRYLVFILIIQLIDISPGIYLTLKSNIIQESKKLSDPIWSKVAKKYKIIKTTKIENTSDIFPSISQLLMEYKFQSTNISRLGRYNRTEASSARSQLYLDLFEKNIDPNTAYIIDGIDHLRHLKVIYSDSNHGFFFRDNIWLLLPNLRSMMSNQDIENLNQIKFTNLEVNKKYVVRQNVDNGFLGLGWSHAAYGREINDSGVWSEGHVNSLIFLLNEDVLLKSIDLNFAKIMTHKSEYLNLEIFINNKFFKKLDLKNLYDYKFDVSTADFKIGINTITFKVKNPITPISKFESVDGRLLGFHLKNILFQ